MKRALAAALVALGSACGPSEERISELRLHQEISRLRESRGDRRMQIVGVKNMPAHTPEGRAAKDACVRAYTHLQDAEDALSQAESMMKGLGKHVPNAAVAEVAAAEAQLAKARAEMPACDEAAAKLAVVAR